LFCLKNKKTEMVRVLLSILRSDIHVMNNDGKYHENIPREENSGPNEEWSRR